MKIPNYNLFNESRIENLFESILNESIVYYSPRLRELLKKFKNSEIATALLDAEKKEIKDDITLVDIDESKPDYLTFTRVSKAIKNIENDNNLVKQYYTVLQDPYSTSHNPIDVINYYFNNNVGNILTKDRNPIKTTRIVNKIVGNKFTPPQVDEFAKKLNAKISKEDRQFKVVEGDDIAFWYKKENYAENRGSLGSSCMKSSPSYFFDIYTENPNSCKLVILLDDENKLLGRALLWKISSHSPKISDDLFFMDRQYTSDPTDVEHFREYATKNGWAYKTHNSIGNTREVTFEDKRYILTMQIGIKDTYNYYPYMDTFKRFDPSSKILHNDSNDDMQNAGNYILQQTDGSYITVDEGYYSEYEDRIIPLGEQIWSDAVDSYITRDHAVRVTKGSNRGWYPEGYDDIVYDAFIDEYIHVDSAIYSEWYDDYIYEENSVRAITEVDSDGEPMNIFDVSEFDRNFVYYTKYRYTPWFKKLSQDFDDWNEVDNLYNDCLFKNYLGNYSLSNFRISLYKLIEISEEASKIGFEMDTLISEKDAKILNCKIHIDEKFECDLFDYHYLIQDVLSEYLSYLGDKSDKLGSIITKKQTLIEFEDNEDYVNKLIKLRNIVSERYNDIKESKYFNNKK